MPRKSKPVSAPSPSSSPPALPDSDLFDNLRARIHTIRGMQVMLDEDLAELYGVGIKQLNQQVKRNQERFPEAFCFQLTTGEVKILRSQIVTLRSDLKPGKSLRSQFGILNNSHKDSPHIEKPEAPALRSQIVTLDKGRGKYRKYLPYVFTEQGVAMLSAVLRSETAVTVSIQIMRAFVEMRRFLHANAGVFQRLDGLEQRQVSHENDTARKFEEVFDALGNPDTPPRQGIFFDGQVYDAHVFVSDLIRQAKRSIVLIDNYLDDTVLTLLAKRRKGVTVDIHTRSVPPVFALDVDKHNSQYPTVTVHIFKESHDRFLILDGETVYHLGASLKDAGKKWFGFSRFDTAAFGLLEKLKPTREP